MVLVFPRIVCRGIAQQIRCRYSAGRAASDPLVAARSAVLAERRPAVGAILSRWPGRWNLYRSTRARTRPGDRRIIRSAAAGTDPGRWPGPVVLSRQADLAGGPG